MATDWGVPEWIQFLSVVDEAQADPDDVKAVAEFFVTLKSVKQSMHLEGMLDSELLGSQGAPADIGARGLVRRAIKVAESAAQAKRHKGSASTASSSGGQLAGMQFQLAAMGRGVGDANSALALASAMQASQVPSVDIQKMLRDKGLDGLPYHCQALHGLWQLLAADTAKARAAQPVRTPFLYVDLTSLDCLPLWITPEAVGGKATPGVEQEWAGALEGATSSMISQLAQALRSTSPTTKQFRSMVQWTGAYQRYWPTAVCTGHLTLVQAMCHLDTVLRVSEEEKCRGGYSLVGIVYDELVRKDWARRAERGDPEFDLNKLTGVIDERQLAAARQRLQPVVRALEAASGGQGGQGSRSATPEEESALAKNNAAAEALVRRAAAATKEMAKQQQFLDSRAQFAHGVDVGSSGTYGGDQNFRTGGKTGKGQPGSKGKPKGGAEGGPKWSNKELKKHNFFAKVDQNRKDRARGSGRGSGWG